MPIVRTKSVTSSAKSTRRRVVSDKRVFQKKYRQVEQPKLNMRQLEAAASKNDILRVAIEEFAENGLSGARVDVIAKRTQTSKRMIYYYFGSKDGLYVEVLERLYGNIREAETDIKMAHLSPQTALRVYVESTFDYHMANPRVGRMIAIENINNARFIKKSKIIRSANYIVIDMLAKLIRRGVAAMAFRADLRAIDLFYLISALCVYRVSNRDTFQAIFGVDFADSAVAQRQKRVVVEMIMSYAAR